MTAWQCLTGLRNVVFTLNDDRSSLLDGFTLLWRTTAPQRFYVSCDYAVLTFFFLTFQWRTTALCTSSDASLVVLPHKASTAILYAVSGSGRKWIYLGPRVCNGDTLMDTLKPWNSFLKLVQIASRLTNYYFSSSSMRTFFLATIRLGQKWNDYRATDPWRVFLTPAVPLRYFCMRRWQRLTHWSGFDTKCKNCLWKHHQTERHEITDGDGKMTANYFCYSTLKNIGLCRK